MRWDGAQWVRVPSPNPGAGGSRLFGVAALSDDNAWAVGEFTQGSGAPYRT